MDDLEKGRDMVRDMPWMFEDPEEQLMEAEELLAESESESGGGGLTVILVIIIMIGFWYALMS